jgi:hypothetical protein
MADIKKGILDLIQGSNPMWEGKVFISAAPDKVDAPYIVISDSSSDPINTTSGSLTSGTLDINIFTPDIEAAEEYYAVLRDLLDKADVGSLRCYYSSDKIDFYPDYELYDRVLTIKYI